LFTAPGNKILSQKKKKKKTPPVACFVKNKYFSGLNCLLPQVTKFCYKKIKLKKKKKKNSSSSLFGLLVSRYPKNKK
jgi:hypothetical protein